MDVNSDFIRRQCLEALELYWPGKGHLISKLPVRSVSQLPPPQYPAKLVAVVLPEWAQDVCVDGAILVPRELAGSQSDWQDIDWWAVCYWYLYCRYEREFEKANKPIHSYQWKLGDWDKRIWQFAWVNRIAMFFCRWAVYINLLESLPLLPKPCLYVTHDLDAVEKTLAIRLKQSAFAVFNSLRDLMQGRLQSSWSRLKQGLRFFLRNQHYWQPEQLFIASNRLFEIRRQINVFAGKRAWWNAKLWLLDPGYRVEKINLSKRLKELPPGLFKIGLHQSFSSWQCTEGMAGERARLEGVLGSSVLSCRQHWLRFSFEHTWLAQFQAGFRQDFTLGFNDLSGFRSAAALAYSVPVGRECHQVMKVVPTIFMDSHLFDYQTLSDFEIRRQIRHWLDELKFVGGTAAVIWHPHVLNEDYGWLRGFEIFKRELAS